MDSPRISSGALRPPRLPLSARLWSSSRFWNSVVVTLLTANIFVFWQSQKIKEQNNPYELLKSSTLVKRLGDFEGRAMECDPSMGQTQKLCDFLVSWDADASDFRNQLFAAYGACIGQQKAQHCLRLANQMFSSFESRYYEERRTFDEQGNGL